MRILTAITFSILCGIIVVATSCYYDNEEYLYPSVSGVRECDTASISYALHIAPILTSKCLNCHSTTAAPSSGGNVVLEGYSNVQKVATSGKLLGAISHTPGFSAMPKGGNKLSYCERTTIRRWIEGDTLNS